MVTSRLCLDRIRSAQSKREVVYDFDGSTNLSTGDLDPADRVTLDDSVRLALLVMMQRLNPAERVVLVLHDVFQMRFEDIAETVGRPVATCRQLARRARQRINDEKLRFDVSVQEHREVTERFITACARGDIDALVCILTPDASGEVDLGVSARSPGVTYGSSLVAANLVNFWSEATLVSLPTTVGPAVLAFRGRRLAALILLTVAPMPEGGYASTPDERVSKVHVIADPAKLVFLRNALDSLRS